VNARDSTGRSALYRAMEQKNELIQTLLIGRQDVDINVQDHFGQSALFPAVHGTSSGLATLLNRLDLQVNIQDYQGRTDLPYAATQSETTNMELLLEKCDIDINIKDQLGCTALCVAADHGRGANFHACRLLPRNDLDVSSIDSERRYSMWAMVDRHFLSDEAIKADLRNLLN
jgi:ankyrin repeat protein